MKEHQHRGLTSAQVEESRRLHGDNLITPRKGDSAWKLFAEKFRDPIIQVLLVAALLSLAMAFIDGEFLETIGIICAIVLATCVGFFFELDAMRRFKRLNLVNDDIPVKVVRDGEMTEVPRRDVVVGDLVYVENGETVPADGKLVKAVSLKINESTLTGEPEVDKTTDERFFDAEATYPSDALLRGTTVVDGYGEMIVEAVGDRTEAGRVTEQSSIASEEPTPLYKQLTRLSRMIGKIGIAVSIAIFVAMLAKAYLGGELSTGDWVRTSKELLRIFMVSVALIVMAVPEGLPMSITLSLALSMRRMLKTNNLVRKMHACETMGAATVICTDKTGTLTRNQMNVYKADFYGLGDAAPAENELGNLIREGIAVNSTAFLDYADPEHIRALGNPTEGALLLWLHGLGVNYLDLRENARVLEQLTFSTERKYMATVAESPLLGKKVLYVKGAPEIVLGLCSTVLTPEGQVPAADMRPAIEEQLLAYQNQAMRTLGFAYRVLEDDAPVFEDGRIIRKDLVYLGIAAISDPVRDDVPQAVKDCMDAGIRIKIVTGDTPGTAREIGRQIGLWTEEDTPDRLMTGVEFEQTPDAELLDRVMDLKIMCRARPMDKERLVKLLQKKDQVVAVTGDGTNDAPALNAAQVGLSMGDGTTVAKEASAITILDNSFMSISRAVMWGRSLYRNIQRFIVFQMTINVAACLIVLIGAFLGTESPLTVTQMLWVNLIMDTFAALALASLPPDERVMQDPPRKTTDHIITRPMGRNILGVGILFVAFLFGLLQYFKHADITSLTQFSLSGYFRSYLDFSTPEHELTGYELSLFF
uniref:calcium-translocating P-type ATPase, PMCA-type n=1 Tax=Alistipes putredinis TaxID=28117 RepID=UPI003AF6BF60